MLELPNRSFPLVCLFVFILAVAGCDAPPPVNGGGGDDGPDDVCTNGIESNGVDDVGTNGICTNGVGDDDGDNEVEPPEAGEGDQFRLTLTLDGLGDGVEGMRVYVIDDDVAYSRENAPFFDAVVSFHARSDENPDVFVRNIAAGQQVTLVAIEAKGITTQVGLFEDSLPIPFQVEFVGWLGDSDAEPEDGVATLEMDGDKEVTAMFQVMPSVEIVKTDENNPQLLGGCYDFTIDAPPLLAFPTDLSLDGTREDFCAVRLVGHVKTGTVFTLNATDANGCDVVSGTCSENFERWEDDAAPCGSDRECMFQVDTPTKVTAVWRDNS